VEPPDHPLLSPKNFWHASAYLLLLGILGAVVVELNKEHGYVTLEGAAVLLSILAILGGWRLDARLRRFWHGKREIVSLSEGPPRAAAALIAFVSWGPGRSSCLQAIEHHAATLRHLWLITTRTATADAEWMRTEVSGRYPDILIHNFEFLDDKDSIMESKEKVEHLRRLAMKHHRVAEADLICDFTGLTKNASAGMILACAPREARLQYMVPDRVGSDGRADPSSDSHPREVDLRYRLVEETDEDGV
jgi:hypothetical protein